MVRSLEQVTMRKVYLRILPFAALTYFFCYLDRINVGFAALTMNKDIGLDAAIYGMAAGAFFWGYVLFEVPSNIILEKVGARLWIARIMITWGLISAATAFATGPYSFMAIRFLLGLAEAGLFPGFVLYFTYWFPDSYRARINSSFTLALPIAVATGAPISTALLGLSNMQVGWVTMIPYVCGAIAMVFCGWLSDRIGERRWTLFWTCTLAAAGLIVAGLTIGTWWSVVGMSIAAAGFYGTKGPFWSMPTMFLTGAAAASGIAWINSLGNLGGFFGPSMVGWARELSGSYAGGLYALAACAVVSSLISLFWLRIPRAVAANEEYPIPAE